MVYNKQFNHKVLVERLREIKDYISVEYNMMSRKMPFYDFLKGKYVNKYDAYLTYLGNYLVIRFFEADTANFVNVIIITKRSFLDKLSLDFLDE
jgi:hypothetical protein